MASEPQRTDQPGVSAGRAEPAELRGPDTAAAPAPGTAPLPQHTLRRTRISGIWVMVACFAVVLLMLLIFILENGRTVEVSYFGAHGHLPLGVALLLAAVAGILLITLPGAARILQLRVIARRHRRADAQHLAPAQTGNHISPHSG